MVVTPLYVAREVLLRRKYGLQADVCGLGDIFHILQEVYQPFYEEYLVQLVNMVKYESLLIFGDEWFVFIDTAREFISQLLTRDVSKRIN